MAENVIDVKELWKVYSKKDIDLNVEDEEMVESLDKSSDSVVAVRDVTFSVKPGEVFIVMGLSGSGKSTLIRCLLRLVDISWGSVTINGQDVTAMNKKELTEFRRNQAAMVFQHYGLLPHRTVIENVAFGLKLRGIPKKERRERARETLNIVGLEQWGDYYPASLSGGMRQRVGIARALVADTPLLLMDEPFSGLDPLIRREMQDELVRIQEELHKTIFFVTHDLDEAMRLGDRMAVMRNGEIVQIGRPPEVFANPADDYVARFVQDKRDEIRKTDEQMAALAAQSEKAGTPDVS
ncbi:MAG TPA: betaine/proline/choline family ABC transporter ATP-binding protein [Syntrophorhabdaceae bacterium]|jgi:glycine betaine/proline transport system ATP-binding protein|nr:betaine/proline/choline family ABC transporter ATP-binding protein [Synergistales bacterium]MDI9392412.1 betaine/proline/choline family ABC transporter ATP-binding protein [Synergistota bacterium]NLV65276.1 betaine/proline/choline family ABC transporter ATP-binding protein [Synergistaceae bacterium]HNT43276.1 betaine/proline/choline family ABC transporter ATP-binding protein [Syntrophorhabdaceae bacterium]HRW87197.1 betaine/proline/choline family ABC transporter ATP-binding protein [Thermovi